MGLKFFSWPKILLQKNDTVVPQSEDQLIKAYSQGKACFPQLSTAHYQGEKETQRVCDEDMIAHCFTLTICSVEMGSKHVLVMSKPRQSLSSCRSVPCEGQVGDAHQPRGCFLLLFVLLLTPSLLLQGRGGSSSRMGGVAGRDLTWIVNEWIKVWMWASIHTALFQLFFFLFCLLWFITVV